METMATAPPSTVTSGHLVTFPGHEWYCWQWACLRSAGFPINGILKLAASPELIEGADEVTKTNDALHLARQNALDQINAALDSLRASGGWQDKKTRNALLDSRHSLNEWQLPRPLPPMVSPQAFEEFSAAIRQTEIALDSFKKKFAESERKTTETIREIAGSPAFREAVAWQNRAAVKTALDPLLRQHSNGSPRSSRQKQHEELVASYWQRYCVKNDTIGFFGPVGWARFSPDVDHLEAHPGEQLLAKRTTYWEIWAIEALATAITRKYDVQPWTVPIMMPFIRVDNTVLHHPVHGPIRITAKQASVVHACDGRDTARQIAQKLMAQAGTLIRTEKEVYEILKDLAARRMLSWTFNITMGPNPERDLRSALLRIDDLEIRRWGLDRFAELDAARVSLDEAAGDAEKLNHAFDNLEQVFTRLTGSAATRNQGKVYAGRTLLYEDCRRDVDVLLGPELLNSLIAPLGLLLASARWFTSRVSEIYRASIMKLYSDLTRSMRATTLDAGILWQHAMPFFYEKSSILIEPVLEEFRSKWNRILQLGSGREPIHFSSDELRERIRKEFPADHPGWLAARHHSPDIMIAAASPEAIQRGDYFFVMGEMHVSRNTLNASLFVNQHPNPLELLKAVEQDLGPTYVVPVGLRAPEQGCRTVNTLIGESHVRLEYMPDAYIADRDRAIPLSSLVLENQKGKLVVRTRDGSRSYDAINLVGDLLSVLVIDCFKIMAPRPHTPRVSIDRLVIKRESWQFVPSELEFVRQADAAERFLKVRTWARENGIPRFAFFKVPIERKPAYLDFESPILVDMFVKMIRRTIEANPPDARIEITEMLPDIENAWLGDINNRRYTSEFRIVIVDSNKVAQDNH